MVLNLAQGFMHSQAPSSFFAFSSVHNQMELSTSLANDGTNSINSVAVTRASVIDLDAGDFVMPQVPNQYHFEHGIGATPAPELNFLGMGAQRDKSRCQSGALRWQLRRPRAPRRWPRL